MFLFTSLPEPTQSAGPAPVREALAKASASTGVSFAYLATTAQRESGFRTNAQAKTSSARGLFQFVEQTWLRLVREEGAGIGLSGAAKAITIGESGRASVADAGARAAILKLRDDPAIASQMAAALTRKNAAMLEAALGRAPNDGELYIAHFLGPSAAGRLIRMAGAQPDAAAASAFPAAADANRSIFFGRDGSARSASDVYARLTRGYGPATETAVAAPAEEQGSLFHRLFGRRQAAAAVSPVAAFWAAERAGQPMELNLFRSPRSTIA